MNLPAIPIVTACTLSLAALAAETGGGTLGVLESFDTIPIGPVQRGFLDSWRWNEAQRAEARTWSRIEIAPSSPETPEGRCLRVVISNSRALAESGTPVWRLPPYLPPEADAIRLRVRVLSGEISLYLGGPTAYYANSDVFTRPQTLRASPDGSWKELDFPLNDPLWRNFRRSGFSTDAPRCCYNRWAQEPPGIYLAPDSSAGEVRIDRVEVLARGRGRPFPTYAPGQIEKVRSLADFEDGQTGSAFTCYMAAAEEEWFEESWRRTKPLRFEPLRLSIADTGLDGRRSLQSHGRSAEEVHCAGFRVTTAAAEGAAANAFAITLRAEAPGRRDTLLGAGPVVPVDFIVFVAPPDHPFPWSAVAASDELRALGGPGFDYHLTHRVISQRKDLHFALYQTRRYLKPGEWTRLVLPAADFTCIYGQGAMHPAFATQAPLDLAQVIAFAWINPWTRGGARDAPVTTCIDQLDLVSVPGTAEENRSFWQVPDVSRLQRRDGTVNGVRVRHFALPAGTR